MNRSQDIFASSTNQQINSKNIEENADCNICARTFRTNRGLLQHLNFCRIRNITNNGNQIITTNDDNNDNTSNSSNSNSNDITENVKCREKNKTLFMLTSGAAGVTSFMKLWIQDTTLKSISLKAVHVIPALRHYFSKNQANPQKSQRSSPST